MTKEQEYNLDEVVSNKGTNYAGHFEPTINTTSLSNKPTTTNTTTNTPKPYFSDNCKFITKHIVGWGLGLAILMVCIMVPLSFHYIQYNEYAFVRDKFGKTETDEVITQGRYFYTLKYDIIRFPSTYTEVRFVDSDAQSVFTKEGYQILLSISFWYKIPPESLGNIYRKYSLNYKNSIVNEAKLIIKNLAGTANTGLNVEVERYITDRYNISQIIASVLSKQLYDEFGIDVPTKYVKLMYVGIPDSLLNQYSRTVEQIQRNQLEQNKQALELIKAETQTIVTNTKVQTDFILNSAKIDADRIVSNSKAFANNIITSQRGKGLKIIMDRLNITLQDDINRMIRIMSLTENQNNKIFYNMDNKIIVNS
jgi:hypothetical protein